MLSVDAAARERQQQAYNVESDTMGLWLSVEIGLYYIAIRDTSRLRGI